MKKRLFLILSLAVTFVTIAQAAGQFTVSSIKGKVTFLTNNGQRLPLEVNDIVDNTTIINIPFHATLELIDQTDNKRYTIKAPGRAPISVLLKDNRNSMENLTRQYVKTLVNTITNSGTVKGMVVTEPAAITRKQATVKESDGMELDLDMDMDMDMSLNMNFSQKDLINEYRQFRQQCTNTYTNWVRDAWQSYKGEAPKKAPQEKDAPPVFIPINDDGEEGKPITYEEAQAEIQKGTIATAEESTASFFSFLGKIVKGKNKEKKVKENKNQKLAVEKVHDDVVKDKPKESKALVPIAPAPAQEGGVNTFFTFSIFGTKYQVRLNERCRFKLNGVTENNVADAIESLSDIKYDNMLFDCLKIRKENKLSDWAYFQTLEAMTNEFCGKGTNEATLLMGYILSQSGYKVRLGRDNQKLVLLTASHHTIYNKVAYRLDGETFYLLEGGVETLSICRASLPNETSISLMIRAAQKFDMDQSDVRTIKSRDYPDLKVTIHTNKNLLKFYDTYLPSCMNDELMTRWAMYANTPLSEDVKEELYPQLRSQLKGLSKLEAMRRLLNLIQTGLVYEYDENIWGVDRAFFAEETLYYPYCDCEDRSILLSRLVRDILGLKAILIYYPGHLAMAVHFPEEVSGDYILLEGEKYIVCDPTYIAATVGRTMPGMNNNEARVILLQ
ncbi:MAG: hypothetical protein J5658_11795 [Prevotella sp.]|nr:hypothetical protein [Prevotella sp.]